MSRTLGAISIIGLLVAGLFGQNAFATAVAVGPSTCKPSLVHFSTIQAAVNAVPFGTTIDVCPGNYPEQVVISQPLTLTGVTDGTGNAAVITVPGGGLLLQNGTSTSFGAVAAQLMIENTVGVTINNLTVDGTGASCPGTFVFPNRITGIGVLNVGSANDGTAAAKIQNVVIRHEQACFGDGILADTSYATITGNEIRDINQTAIDAYSAKYAITNNSIQHANTYGIVILNNDSGSVLSGNNVSDGWNGILTEGLNPATITKNTVLNNFYVGVWIFSAYNQTVTYNVVSNSSWPLVVEFGFNDTVQNNKITYASFLDGILDEVSFGGNNITKNTVNEAPFGIFADIGSKSVDTLVPNTFYNTVITIDPGPPQTPTDPGPTP
jgi:parallel beta-helix repeat protein